MSVIDRRQVLASTACAVLLEGTARAVGRTISGALPWEPFDGAPSAPARPRSLAVLHERRSRCGRGDRGHLEIAPFISLKFVGWSADRRAQSKS
jgi:hypothetical protein